MGFATPWLWVLAAGLAVPLWVHLARRPHDTGRAVASLMFLRRHDVKQTRARTLRDRWLLLLRLLLWLTLIAALAEPFVKLAPDTNESAQAMVVIVDQSASMSVDERHAEATRALDAVLGELSGTSAPVALLAATATSRQLVDFTTDRAALRSAFAAATPVPLKGRLRPALAHAADLLREAEFHNGRIVLISDLQQSAMPATEGAVSVGNHTVEIHRVGKTVPRNLTLASMRWQPDTSRIAVRVEQSDGHGDSAATLQVHVNGHQVLEEALELGAGASRTFHIPVTPAADRTVEVVARVDDARYDYDNVTGLIIGAQRAVRYRTDFSGQVPEQLSAALRAFRSPQFQAVTPGASTDLVMVSGSTLPSGISGSATIVAFGGMPEGAGADLDSLLATSQDTATPIGQFDANTLAPELVRLRDALGAVEVPGARALNAGPDDRILMRWASGEAAAVLRAAGARRALTIGIPPGASLDSLGRSRVFAPLLREWVMLALTAHTSAANYAPGEQVVRGAQDANRAHSGGVVVAPDGVQTRWPAGAPLFAPLVPGRYEVVRDGEGDAGGTWAFWVRHDLSEANLTAMQTPDLNARIQRGQSTTNGAEGQAVTRDEARSPWWRAALTLVLLLALLELWLAARAPSLEESAA